MDRYPFFDFCKFNLEEILKRLNSHSKGLSSKEAEKRRLFCKKDLLKKVCFPKIYILFLNQFRSPLSLLLTFCAILAFFISDTLDAWIILAIILISSLLGVFQENKAHSALESLMNLVDIKISALRDGEKTSLSQYELVPGDVIFLQAGDPIPADCVILESDHLFVNESALSGESRPIEKQMSLQACSSNLNILWMGSYIISGYTQAVVVNIGAHTNFGKIAQKIKSSFDQTSFEKSVYHLGSMLVEVTFLLVIVIFAINMLFKRDLLESFLFSLALGIGLTPQLLPMILTVTLSKGATLLAKKSMITKKLSALENLGSMDVLCCDKTGTLTEGLMSLNAFCDMQGRLSEKTLTYAYLSAFYQSGFKNPFDEAILKRQLAIDTSWKKLAEVPFDFARKRFSILLQNESETILVTKGDFSTVLPLCSFVENNIEGHPFVQQSSDSLLKLQQLCAKKTIKLLAIAYKKLPGKIRFIEDDEKEMTFLGYLEFLDPIKQSAKQELENLKNLGINLKVISGDNFAIVKQLGKELNFKEEPLTGAQIDELSDTALAICVEKNSLFSEVNPLNKERLILALKSQGRTVGFLGDGINDCVAMKQSDVSISVDSGTNVAKESADFIMTTHSLDVLKESVICGRNTFANTLKYIFMATSANFGNMFSMAFSSLMLSFIPFLPKQILLINFLTDIPELTIASDNVDQDWSISPQKWNFSFIKKFMVVFGLLSSFFDFLTFFLLKFLHLSQMEFRTGWFLESVLSASGVLLIVRTKNSVFKSYPSRPLCFFVFSTMMITIAIPYSFLGPIFGFVPIKAYLLSLIILIVILYVTSAEFVKKMFYKSTFGFF